MEYDLIDTSETSKDQTSLLNLTNCPLIAQGLNDNAKRCSFCCVGAEDVAEGKDLGAPLRCIIAEGGTKLKLKCVFLVRCGAGYLPPGR